MDFCRELENWESGQKLTRALPTEEKKTKKIPQSLKVRKHGLAK